MAYTPKEWKARKFGCQILGAAYQNEKILAQNEKILAPSEKVLAPSEKILAPSEKILAQNEKILAPSEKVLAQKEKILARSEKILARSEKILAQNEKILVFFAGLFVVHKPIAFAVGETLAKVFVYGSRAGDVVRRGGLGGELGMRN